MARFFVVRLFTRKSIPRLIEAADAAREELEETTALRDGCFVEVDFGFDKAARKSYEALVQAFQHLCACHRIWAMTAVKRIDGVKARTIATTAINRSQVLFDFATPEIVKLSQRAMRLGTASGKQLYLYPGFLMMRDGGSDFALIEYRELEGELAEMRFVEEEALPPDAEVVGHTWKRANKDGSRDLRFNDNYQIPLARYADLELKTPNGLHEEFEFSDFKKGRAFYDALTEHERALAALARADTPPPVPVPVADDDPAEGDAEPHHQPAVPTDPYVLDWIALGAILVVSLAGGNWTLRHRAELDHLIHPSAAALPPPAPEVAAPAHKPSHKHHKKIRHSTTAVPSQGGGE